MTRAEVEATIQREFSDVKPEIYFEEPNIWLRLDPNDPRYNMEIIRIIMSNGRVISKEYLPD